MKVAYHPKYEHSVPEKHKFPMEKYSLLKDQLIHNGIISKADLFEPKQMDWDIVEMVHSKDYLDKLKCNTLKPIEQRKIGFEWSEELIERELVIMQGTLDCALYALDNNYAFNIAGGTHHAYSNKGEGFCLMNDFAIASTFLLKRKLASKILIIDLDVHQGNGTAKIFNSSSNVFTFSMHGRDNYPLKKEFSSLDIPLKHGVGDKEYLFELNQALRQFNLKPKFDFVFYQSGVDVLETDKLGKMSLSAQGCMKRDRMVFEFCKNNELPVVSAMGGGYSKDINEIVRAHCQTFEQALAVFS
ncbi:MAG: histone deacetylase [Salibacteraceae bacterium]